MSRLGDRIGVLGALAFAAVLLVAARQSLHGYAAAARQPVWLWSGAVMSLLVVLAITYSGARLGTAATIGILIAGQLAMGALIDRFGLLGSQQIPLHWPRLLGIALLAAGAALSLRK
jgi:bacterial/archaeal transporter family-2 protein